MPVWAQDFVNLQPFRFTLSFSLELVVGDLSGRELLIGMALQLLYPVLTVIVARRLWRCGLRNYSAVGA
jgi:ABC-2 type transport system permease protein